MQYRQQPWILQAFTHQKTPNSFAATGELHSPGNKQTIEFEAHAPEAWVSRWSPNVETFLIAALIPCMEAGADLHVQGTVNAKLLYLLNTQLIPAVCSKWSALKPIRVTAEETTTSTAARETDAHDERVAVLGMSCGLDALTAYVELSSPEAPPHLRPQALLFSDAGAFGKGEAKREHDLAHVLKFAATQDMPVIQARSNLHQLCRNKYADIYSFCNASMAWFLQPIARSVTYGSSVTFGALTNPHDYEPYSLEPLLFALLSTTSFELHVSGFQHRRSEKFQILSQRHDLIPYLNTCLRSVDRKNGYVNCGHCKKCAYILFKSEFLQSSQLISTNFDIPAFHKKRSILSFQLARAAYKKNRSESAWDVVDLLGKQHRHYKRLPFWLGRISAWVDRIV